MDIFRFIPGYQNGIFEAGREPALIMMLAFLATFILTRFYTRMARVKGWGSAYFGGVHTHHLVFGLVMAFLAGALEFSFLPHQGFFQLFLAALFGSGAALVLDEFALIFHLKDVYWQKEGRQSIDAVVIGALLGGVLLLQTRPFGITDETTRNAITVTIIINLIFVLTAALKGRVLLSVFGVFVPILAILGAIRLAEPKSVWAHRRYKSKPSKLQKAKARHDRFMRKWEPLKDRLLDFIGGKVS
jgi:hypothetical protein